MTSFSFSGPNRRKMAAEDSEEPEVLYTAHEQEDASGGASSILELDSSTASAKGASAKSGSSQSSQEEDTIMVFENDEIQDNGLHDGLVEYVDRDLGGGAHGEARTTQTTNAPKYKKTKVPFDSYQWTAVIFAMLSLLTAAGWHVYDKLPQFAEAKHEPMRIPSFDRFDPRQQQAELKLKASRLRSSWEKAPEGAKAEFLAKYFPGAQSDSGATAVTDHTKHPLHVILEPVDALVGDSSSDDSEFLRQVTLMNGVVQAAIQRLKTTTEREHSAEQAGPTPPPSSPDQEGSDSQAEELVDFIGFALLLRGRPPFSAKQGVPRALVEELKTLVLHGTSQQAAGIMSNFEDFWNASQSQAEVTDVTLPPGDEVFPVKLFIDFVDALLEGRPEFQAAAFLEKLTSNWSTESVVDAIKHFKQEDSRSKELTAASLENACKQGYCTESTNNVYTTTLRLLGNP